NTDGVPVVSPFLYELCADLSLYTRPTLAMARKSRTTSSKGVEVGIISLMSMSVAWYRKWVCSSPVVHPSSVSPGDMGSVPMMSMALVSSFVGCGALGGEHESFLDGALALAMKW